MLRESLEHSALSELLLKAPIYAEEGVGRLRAEVVDDFWVRARLIRAQRLGLALGFVLVFFPLSLLMLGLGKHFHCYHAAFVSVLKTIRFQVSEMGLQ